MKGIAGSIPAKTKKPRQRNPDRSAEYERLKARRAEMKDEEPIDHEDGTLLTKAERIDLGLSRLHDVALPGVVYTRDELAYWAGCTDSAIQIAEEKAIHTFRRKLHLHCDPVLRDLVVGLFEDRRPARRHDDPIILTWHDL